MVLNLQLPDNYPLALLSASVVPFVANIMMGVPVMQARKAFDVRYPNLYAVPGTHKDADAFNRVQRGHQNTLESMPNMIAMTLVGGIGYPLVASASMLIWWVGSFLYLKGYADTKLDVKTARYQKGGGIKWLGVLGLLVSSVATCYQLYTK